MKKILLFMVITLVGIMLVRSLFTEKDIIDSAAQKDKIPQEIYMVTQGNRHIELEEDHPAYNSVPPTSGWHYIYPANWGVYDVPIQDEILVHNMEHGGIIIYYKPDIAKDVIEKIKTIGERYEKRVIVVPYLNPKLEKNIALTAWNYLDKFNEFDEARIVGFISRHINQGPEHVDD